MPLIDARARGLDALFTRGNTFPVTVTWPAGALTGRTFTATLDAATLSLNVVGEVMTITVSEAQSTAAADSGVFTLTETTGGGTQALMVGIWGASELEAASDELAVQVVSDGAEITVEYPGIPQAVGGGFTVGGDITVGGEILTGTLAGGNTFGGIEREARPWTVQLSSPSATMDFGSDVPRMSCPNSADPTITVIYASFEVEEWWLIKPDGTPGRIGIYFEWINDSGLSGNVRWVTSVRAYKIGQDTLASGGTLMGSRTFTQAAPDSDKITTSVLASTANGNPALFPTPGILADIYVAKIQRTAFHADDTLEGPVGFFAANMTRGQ